MTIYLFLFILICYWGIANCKNLPSYISPCKRANPSEGECSRKSAAAAIPYLAKGDKEYKIPVLDPLRLPQLEMKSGPNLKLTLTDVSLFGLSKMQVTYHNIDTKAQRVNSLFKSEFLTLSSQYTISGQILILPITGSGAANISFHDSTFNYTFHYKLLKKSDGKEYVNITTYSTDLDVTKAYFHLDNLFNGNKELGDNMNKFLNDNAKEVVRDMGYPGIIELVQVLAAQVLQAIFSVVPYDELLPT